GGQAVADAFLRLRRDRADGLTNFFENGPLIGARACEIFVNRRGFGLGRWHSALARCFAADVYGNIADSSHNSVVQISLSIIRRTTCRLQDSTRSGNAADF